MTSDQKPDGADRIAAYIAACSQALETQSQAARGWPNPLVLPEPEDAEENEALGLFLTELRQATGTEIKFRFRNKPH